MPEELLKIKNLSVIYHNRKNKVLDNVSFSINKGEIFGIIGESGSGKTTLAFSLLNLLNTETKTSGEIFFEGKNILSLEEKQINNLRGREISLIFQDPFSSFNPVYTIGFQMAELLRYKGKFKSKKERRQYIEFCLQEAGLSNPEKIMASYPHTLSGGMLQRVAIAQSISTHPKLLIADEPTSNLDVTSESQILNLFLKLRKHFNLTIIFITHNLDLIKAICERVAVIKSGKIREVQSMENILFNPSDAYTKELIQAFRNLGELE